MRHVRLLSALVAARFRAPLAVDGVSTIRFRVWPTDVDVSYANHAAIVTVMETGRIDFMVRSGFGRVARRRRWYVPLRRLRVRYLRPLRVGQRAVLTTRVVHADDEVIFLEHRITRHGKDVAVALVDGVVKEGRERVPLDRIAAELGIRAWPRTDRATLDAIGR